MESLRLIVGLGNPGTEYAATRHNIGFLVVEELARRQCAGWTFEKKFNARLARGAQAVHKLLLAQPQTFMNASGEAVKPLLTFYRVSVGQLLVIVDDADLPFGELRLRPGGSSGGHHGLESLEQHVGSREFARLRVGIGRKDGRRDIAGHVLGKFSVQETPLLNRVVARAADQAECWAADGAARAMNQFNGMVNPEREEA